MSLKGNEVDDAANDFWTASKSYKKSNPERECCSARLLVDSERSLGAFIRS